MPPHKPDDDEEIKLPEKVAWLDSVLGKWGLGTVIALTFLAAFLAGLYYVGSWTAAEVAKPLVVKHLQFLDETLAQQKALQKTQDTIAESTKTTADAVKSMAAAREESIKDRRHQTEILDSLNQQQQIHAKNCDEKLDALQRKLIP